MKSLSQRAQPRVKYPVDVRLLAPGQATEGERVIPAREVQARSHNLSASGIFVESRQLVEVGTRVLCEIPLPGGTRRLAGEVARLQPLPFSSSAVGLGIRFVELDPAARTLLEALVQRQQEPAHLVHARFEGMSESIRSQAVLTSDGVRLSAALPFLRPTSTVEISFVSGNSRVLSRGIVREAHVDSAGPDGVPRLMVDVRLQNRTGALGRPEDGADMVEEPEEVTTVDTPKKLAAQLAARPSSPRPAPEPVHRTIERAGRRPLRMRGRPRRQVPGPPLPIPEEAVPRPSNPVWMVRAVKAGLGLSAALALFVIGAAVARQRLAPAPVVTVPAATAPAPIAVARVAPPPPAAPRADEAPPPANLPPALYLPWRKGQTPAAKAPPRRPAPAAAEPTTTRAPAEPAPAPAEPATAPEPPELLPPSGVRQRPDGPPPELAAPAFSTEAVLRTARPVPEGSAGPTAFQEGEELVAEVPFEGSTEGMTHYPLAQPRGIAVNLPNARSVLALGRHSVMNDGVRWVWIRNHERGGIQVRFTLAYRTPEVRGVEVVDGRIRLRLVPAPPKSDDAESPESP